MPVAIGARTAMQAAIATQASAAVPIVEHPDASQRRAGMLARYRTLRPVDRGASAEIRPSGAPATRGDIRFASKHGVAAPLVSL